MVKSRSIQNGWKHLEGINENYVTGFRKEHAIGAGRGK